MKYRWFLIRERYYANYEHHIFEIPVWACSEEEALKRFRGCYYPGLNATAEAINNEIAETYFLKIR